MKEVEELEATVVRTPDAHGPLYQRVGPSYGGVWI